MAILRNYLMSSLFAGVLALTLPVSTAEASCAYKARSAAQSNSGRVLSVSTFSQNGATMCRITVLVTSSTGGPARKKIIIVQK